VDAIGLIVCVRGVTVESYDFDYDSQIFVFNGEFGCYSPRIIFVLEVTRIARQKFYESEIPFLIHTDRSMIPLFMRGKKATTYYPLLRIEIPTVKKALSLQTKFFRLRRTYCGCHTDLVPKNFFEFVLKCRLEYYEFISI